MRLTLSHNAPKTRPKVFLHCLTPQEAEKLRELGAPGTILKGKLHYNNPLIYPYIILERDEN